ncbi:ribonuclease H2 subunit C [Cladophialophora carrionii]|uniref:Ribonuclease H2 subunit C n=1 Tax=Cladophialophora carrionii TaxID=86049 RepID=A0A1C1C8R7_9EURO|nr:ribonuclease H2 subunit C [Cladophialophora carrionii]
MLALQRLDENANKRTVNILPCRIHHNGPTKVTKRYWLPQVEKDGTTTSYFRGRKLRGKVITLPAGYRGVVAKSTDKYLPQPIKSQNSPTYTAVDEDIEIADDEDEPPEPVRILEETSTFEDMVVWGHDIVPTNEDPFVKGIEEWISFAEAIHGDGAKDDQHASGDEKKSA